MRPIIILIRQQLMMPKSFFNFNMKSLIRSILVTLSMLVIVRILPEEPIDPWNAIGLKKIASLITAITFIQLIGSEIIKRMGTKLGSVLTGFLGGLVSSTAVVTEVARSSKLNPGNVISQMLIFISATIAMQVVCVLIVLLGTKDIHYSLFLILLAPIFSAIAMIYVETRKDGKGHIISKEQDFEFLHVIKLTVFIIGTILISKASQEYLKESGVAILTFIVSMFEMHGSIVANLQLHDNGLFDVNQLGTLIAISVVASFISKLFLVFTLGSSELKSKVLKYTVLSLVSLTAGWILFKV
jgi:uncharacterized membrane protein (DUF4010 family)